MSEQNELPSSPPDCPVCGCIIRTIGRRGIDPEICEHPDTEGCVLDEFHCSPEDWFKLTRADDWRKMAERLAEELKPVAAYNYQVGNSVHAISSSREYVEGCVQRHNERIGSSNKVPAKVVPANSRAEALDAFNALLARDENK